MSTAVMETPKTVWEANRGGQWLFLSCPYWELLVDGDRGGGKSAGLIASFLHHVGEGYGTAWRGVIFRLTYPELGDLIDKSHELIEPSFPGARYNRSEHEWHFPDGEKLLFRHLENLKSYRHYHGHAFCLVEGESVKSPLGDIPIEKLRVGDPVYTPSGVRKVTRLFDTGIQPCVRASLFDSYWNLIGQQLQSAGHQILTTDGWQSVQPHLMSCIFLRHQMLNQLGAFGKHHAYGHRGSSYRALPMPSCLSSAQSLWRQSPYLPGRGQQSYIQESFYPSVDALFLLYAGRDRKASHGCSTDGRSYSSKWHGLYQACQQSLSPYYMWGGVRELAPSLYGFHQRQSNGYYVPDKSCGQLREIWGGHVNEYWDWQQHDGPFQSSLDYASLSVYSYAGCDSPLSLDWMGDCSPCRDPYDELFLGDGGISGFLSQQLTGALEHSHLSHRMGAVEGRERCTHGHSAIVLPHPYGREPIVTYLPLDHGYVTNEPIGSLQTYDIEVDEDNCYFTTTGIINKNSMIGFDELTSWPTHEPYEAMLSCSRPPSSKPGIPLMIRSTTNSWGVGFSWVKARFIQGREPFKPYGPPGRERIRIPILWRENERFVDIDPDYHARLADTITDEAKRKAWLENSWDIIAGGRFSGVWSEATHVIEPFNIPQSWRIDRSHDWGSSSPYCTLWYAESNGEVLEDGRRWPKGTLFVIHEDYGCAGDMFDTNFKPNVGLELTPVEIAERTRRNEVQMREWGLIKKTPMPGPADDPIFDTSRGRSMASMMSDIGVVWLKPTKGPGSRITGWQVIEDRLKESAKYPMEKPGLFIFDTCHHLIRTLPIAPRDPKKPDDIDTSVEDHALDSLRLRLLSHGSRNIIRGVSL